MAGIHEQLQRVCLLLTDGNSGTVEPIPRPMQLHEVALKRLEAQEKAEERKETAESKKAATVAAMDRMFND